MSRAAALASIEAVTETELEVREAGAALPEGPGRPAPASRSGRVTVIRPSPRLPRLDLGELWHYRELLGIFVWRDLKVRYKQTFIGVAWAILQPFLTMVVFTLVFGKFANFPSQNLPYPVFLFSGLLPWTYFASAVTQSSSSVVSNVNLVTKVYFPRFLLPFGAVLVPIVDFLLAFCVFLGVIFYYGAVVQSTVVAGAALPAPRRSSPRRCRPLALGDQRPLPRRPLRGSLPDPDLALPLARALPDARPPGEVAVDLRAEPDEHRRSAASAGRSSAPPRRRTPSSCSAPSSPSSSSSAGSPTSSAPSRASRTRSDGAVTAQTAAISAEGLSKRYRIGQFQAAYGTLRDSVAALGAAAAHRAPPPCGRGGDLGARRTSRSTCRRARCSG